MTTYLDSMHTYDVELDDSELTPTMMTDAGVRVGDLYPIEDCSLTPGDPSPAGRTQDGDLAYVINPKRLHIPMSASQAADIMAALAATCGLTSIEDIDHNNPTHALIATLASEAINPILFTDSAHTQIIYKEVCATVLTKGAKALPSFLT